MVTEAEPVSKAQAKIYVGKGRFVEDDPTKYPSRTETAGGWAGGEVGLKAFVAVSSRGGGVGRSVRGMCGFRDERVYV